jgi:hypothetical protein
VSMPPDRFWCKVADLSRTGIMARMTATGTELFKGRHFDQQLIIPLEYDLVTIACEHCLVLGRRPGTQWRTR